MTGWYRDGKCRFILLKDVDNDNDDDDDNDDVDNNDDNIVIVILIQDGCVGPRKSHGVRWDDPRLPRLHKEHGQWPLYTEVMMMVMVILMMMMVLVITIMIIGPGVSLVWDLVIVGASALAAGGDQY